MDSINDGELPFKKFITLNIAKSLRLNWDKFLNIPVNNSSKSDMFNKPILLKTFGEAFKDWGKNEIYSEHEYLASLAGMPNYERLTSNNIRTMDLESLGLNMQNNGPMRFFRSNNHSNELVNDDVNNTESDILDDESVNINEREMIQNPNS